MKLIKNSAYLRFLHCIDALDRMNPGKSLDATETQLLNYVLLVASKGDQTLVGDLLQLSQLGSQATLHGRIKNLVAMGYVKLTTDKEDGRKKFVEPTKLAMKYEAYMSDCLTKAVK